MRRHSAAPRGPPLPHLGRIVLTPGLSANRPSLARGPLYSNPTGMHDPEMLSHRDQADSATASMARRAQNKFAGGLTSIL